MSDQRCPHCGKIFNDDLLIRMSYRIGRLEARGFFWERTDIAIYREAIEEIHRLRQLVRGAAA
ncbi:hypothetical protein [Shinella zoogloeoides]|uniref:hypothetical protein n=1 Tax=Shinella zoogloeoides TaxID=352475 RepID=UPI001F57F2E4|nr:hypothetical protein [Shinella zoogloeoides]